MSQTSSSQQMRMPSSHFTSVLDDMLRLHAAKSADYATAEDPQQNFRRAAELAGWFTRPEDQVYAVLLGVKLARLASLRRDGREPQHESVADTLLDLANYAALWAARVREEQVQSDDENSICATPFHIPMAPEDIGGWDV